MSIALEIEHDEQTHLGVSKIDRYKWTIKDSRGEYAEWNGGHHGQATNVYSNAYAYR
jgi:hypothetical protein